MAGVIALIGGVCKGGRKKRERSVEEEEAMKVIEFEIWVHTLLVSHIHCFVCASPSG